MKLESSYFQAPSSDAIPRPLVIDGCNIGRSASGFSRTHVDCAGLVAVVRWLFTKNFDVTVFLPVVYNNINNYNARNAELLHKLERLGIVTFTPARSGRGLRKAFINYDDLYVVSYAARHGGCILSGDKFKDILHQNCYSDFHNVIRNRTVDVKFHALPLDFVKFDKDMFYKHVPEMFIYENQNVRNDSIRQKLFVRPCDEDYQLVKAHRRLLSPERREFLCSELDSLLISMSLAAGKEFRHMDELTLLEPYSNGQALRIEDLYTSEVCKEFYRKYPRTEMDTNQSDPITSYVMEPVLEVGDFNWRREIEQIEAEAAAAAAASEKLIDFCGSESTPQKCAPNNDIHPDLAEIQMTPFGGNLPRDLSSSALLEWYTKVEDQEMGRMKKLN